jgi:spore maturation protein CgeB
MRWLIGHPGPHFSVHDVYEGWTEALRGLGEQVFTFNLGDRLSFFDAAHIEAGVTDEQGRTAMRKAMPREKAIETAANEILRPAFLCWPDVVLLVSAFFMPPYLLDVMRGRGMKIVLLHTESPYQDDEQLLRAAHADVNLLNDPVNLAAYREFGPAEYMPHAYRPSIHHPAPPGTGPEYDLSFVGTGFPSRVRFFGEMDLSGLAVKLGGMWMNLPEDSPLRDWTATRDDDCIDNTDTAGIYRRSRAGINFYRREAEETHAGEGWAMGPREVEMAACGLFSLRDPRPESDEVLGMLPAFDGPGDASGKLRWWLAHDGYRAEAALKAREAISGRTFEANARSLLRLLDRQPVSR